MNYVDSWAWIEYFKGSRTGERARQYIESNEPIITTPLTLFEVYHAILRDANEEQADLHLDKIINGFHAIKQELDEELVKAAAKIKKNEGLAMADAFVLATARKHSAKIITGDKDLEKYPQTIFLR